MDRRGFLGKGFLATITLALGHFIFPSVAYGNKSTSNGLFKPNHLLILKIIIPSILGSQLYNLAFSKDNALDVLIDKIGQTVESLPQHTQSEFMLLLELLSFRPTRFALTGLWRSWSDYKRSDINEAFANWQLSSLHIRRMAFGGLKDITLGTIYCDSSLWASIGYPGAPNL